jgi:hypothetical protein
MANTTITIGEGTTTLTNQTYYYDGMKITVGNGNDTLTFGDSSNTDDHDTITIGNGNDIITINGSYDIVTLGNGLDKLFINGNYDTVQLGNNNDLVIATGNYENITLGNGNNTVFVMGTNETIKAGNGNNFIFNVSGIGNSIQAGNGNNTMVYNPDAVLEAGGNGFNTLLVTTQVPEMHLDTSTHYKNFQLIDLTNAALANVPGYGTSLSGFGNTLDLSVSAVDTLTGVGINPFNGLAKTMVVIAGYSDKLQMGTGWHDVTPINESPLHGYENLTVNNSVVSEAITLTSYHVYKQGADTLIVSQASAPNIAPVAHDDSYSYEYNNANATGINGSNSFTKTGLLSNDAHGSGSLNYVNELIAYANINDFNTSVLSISNGGSATGYTVNGNQITLHSDGSFTFAQTQLSPQAESFQYTVSDGLGTSNQANVSLNITDNIVPAFTITGPISEITGSQAIVWTAVADSNALNDPYIFNVSDPSHFFMGFDGIVTYPIVQLNPLPIGNYDLAVTLWDNFSNNSTTQHIPINVIAGFNLSSSSFNFGNQQEGTTSAAQTETITLNFDSNYNNYDAVFISSLSGANPNDFTVTANAPSNGQETINITFTPSTIGSESASFNIPDYYDNTQTVNLTGVGYAPTVFTTGADAVTINGDGTVTITEQNGVILNQPITVPIGNTLNTGPGDKTITLPDSGLGSPGDPFVLNLGGQVGDTDIVNANGTGDFQNVKIIDGAGDNIINITADTVTNNILVGHSDSPIPDSATIFATNLTSAGGPGGIANNTFNIYNQSEVYNLQTPAANNTFNFAGSGGASITIVSHGLNVYKFDLGQSALGNSSLTGMNFGGSYVSGFDNLPIDSGGDYLSFVNVSDLATLQGRVGISSDGLTGTKLTFYSDSTHTSSIGTFDIKDMPFHNIGTYTLGGPDVSHIQINLTLSTLFTNGDDSVVFHNDGSTVTVYEQNGSFQNPGITQNLSMFSPGSPPSYNTGSGYDNITLPDAGLGGTASQHATLTIGGGNNDNDWVFAGNGYSPDTGNGTFQYTDLTLGAGNNTVVINESNFSNNIISSIAGMDSITINSTTATSNSTFNAGTVASSTQTLNVNHAQSCTFDLGTGESIITLTNSLGKNVIDISKTFNASDSITGFITANNAGISGTPDILNLSGTQATHLSSITFTEDSGGLHMDTGAGTLTFTDIHYDTTQHHASLASIGDNISTHYTIVIV